MIFISLNYGIIALLHYIKLFKIHLSFIDIDEHILNKKHEIIINAFCYNKYSKFWLQLFRCRANFSMFVLLSAHYHLVPMTFPCCCIVMILLYLLKCCFIDVNERCFPFAPSVSLYFC